MTSGGRLTVVLTEGLYHLRRWLARISYTGLRKYPVAYSAAPRSKGAVFQPDDNPIFARENISDAPGGNISPPLQCTGAPAGTKSFVVTLFDPDAHDDLSGWWH